MLLVCDSSFVYDFQLGHFMLICYVLDLQNRSKYCSLILITCYF